MNLLITGAWQGAKENMTQLEKLGHSVVFMQNEQDELPCNPNWVEGIIGNGIFLYQSIESFTNLRYIQLTSAGYDRVPMEYVRKHGIEIHNARGVYSVPMAEFAVAGVLSLYKHLDQFRSRQKAHFWEKDRTLRELAGQTVCIVGAGSVGTACAERFKVFGTTVLAVDIRVPQAAEAYDACYTMDQLPQVLAQSDIVVLTLPLTEETRGLFDANMFNFFKRGAVLVNIARGAVVREDALIQALESEMLGGAVLDVFETEPLPEESPLWQMEQVLVTPHNSFVSQNNHDRLFAVILNNLQSYLKGKTEK